MKKFLAVSTSLAAVIAAADAKSFDLRLVERGGDRAVAVSQTGGEALKSQLAKDAVRLEREDAGSTATGERKIIVHKLDIDEDGEHIEKRREVRIIKQSEAEPRGEEERILDFADNDEDAPEESFRLSLQDELAAVDAAKDGEDHRVRHRMIEIIGADEKAAIDFINDAQGLDAAEKQAMRSALGL